MKRWFILTGMIIFIISCYSGKIKYPATGAVRYRLSEEQNRFLDTLQYRTFLYFWNECNPANGLIRDRSSKKSPASIAATGFGIVAWAIGAEHGWITRESAAERTLTLFRFLMRSEQNPSPSATGYQGFYYHFLNMTTGARMWKSELSTIDTAWLLAGVRFAVHYYSQNNPVENEIRTLGDSLTFRVKWDFMTLPDTGHYAGTISLGWFPEKGLHEIGWVGYNEALYLYILAAGSGYQNAAKAYRRWLSTYQWFTPYPGLAHVGFPPLFGHQYTHMFIDMRGLMDEYMQKKGIDYFENSRRATLAQRRYAQENPMGWTGYDSLTWGWTACDGPGPSYNHNGKKFNWYTARGMIGSRYIQFDDGTIAPTAAGGSIIFSPQTVIPTLMSMMKRFGEKGLWGRYGFVDAFNLTVNWFDNDYLGIDQGPILIMAENLRTGMVWKYCMMDSVIQEGLAKLHFIRNK